MKHIILTIDEIRTLQYAIHCSRSHLQEQKANKTTQEWIRSDGKHSESHRVDMQNLWNIENKIHGRS